MYTVQRRECVHTYEDIADYYSEFDAKLVAQLEQRKHPEKSFRVVKVIEYY